jgi:hypothetical protein
MRFWVREAAGWLLIALGLYVFWLCYLLLQGHSILEAGPLAFIGFIIFRGGIHLLKVAVAARICLQVQGRLRPAVGTQQSAISDRRSVISRQRSTAVRGP